MCNRCLQRLDGDDGVDWMPVHIGIKGMTSPKLPKYWSPRVNYEKIRFGGSEFVPGWKRRPSYNKDERIEYVEGKSYTNAELEQIADQFLRDASNEIDSETGKRRGIGGKDPILFAEHIYQRQRREILNENGVPEPGLVKGLYDRTHPEGRKVNSPEARSKHGASYFRRRPDFPGETLFSVGERSFYL